MKPRMSGSYKWIYCPGYVRSTADLGDNAGDAAREGTCAAWVAELAINEDIEPVEMLHAFHSNGWQVDEEMIYHVSGYLETIPPGAKAETEIVAFNNRVTGHPDSWWICSETLNIRDLKYGNLLVEHVGCWQTVGYSAGFAHIPWRKAALGIYQPRSAHPDGIDRIWEVSRSELENEYWPVMSEALDRLEEPNSLCIAGSHCKYCANAHRCWALAQTAYSVIEYAKSPTSFNLTDEQLSIEMDVLDAAYKMLDIRKTAIEAEVEERLRKMHTIEGWMLQSGRGNKKWSIAPDKILTETGIWPYKLAIKSPAEVEREGGDIDGLTTRPETKPKLKRSSTSYFDRIFKRNKNG